MKSYRCSLQANKVEALQKEFRDKKMLGLLNHVLKILKGCAGYNKSNFRKLVVQAQL